VISVRCPTRRKLQKARRARKMYRSKSMSLTELKIQPLLIITTVSKKFSSTSRESELKKCKKPQSRWQTVKRNGDYSANQG